MARKPELTAEERQLKDLIRHAHETTQALRQAIREASALAPELVSSFEATHAREIRQLAQHFQDEANYQSANLNQAVTRARHEIYQQLTLAKLEIDKETGIVRLLFNGGRFDDHQPLPAQPTTYTKDTK